MFRKKSSKTDAGRQAYGGIDRRGVSRSWALIGLAGLLIIHFALRYWFIQCPSLLELNYDEAIVGLMTFDALAGHFPTFIWGQAYMGPLDAYFALPWTAILGVSAHTMRLSMIIMGSLLLLAVYGSALLAGGRRAGLWAALYWAAPPLFLLFISIHVSGGHLAAVAGGGLFMWGACRFSLEPRPSWGVLIALGSGLAAGLGFWASLLCAALILSAGVGMILVRPRLLFGYPPWLMGLGFFMGSAPFWLWNLEHDWMSFRLLGHGSHFLHNVQNLFVNVWLPSLTGGWWGGKGVTANIHPAFIYAVLLLVYLPCVLFVLYALYKWIRRAAALSWPFKGPSDILVICLLALMAAHANSSYGNSSIMRYAMVLFPPLAALMGLTLTGAWRIRPYLALGMAVLLLAFNLTTLVLYRERHRDIEPRPLDALVAAMQEKGITHAFSHARTAFPLYFESGGHIKAADYFGLRNLELKEEVSNSKSPAIFTSRKLGTPMPEDWDHALASLGAPHERYSSGEYVMWHSFAKRPPATPVPASAIKAELEGGRGGSRALLDRSIFTELKTRPDEEAVLSLDLGQVRQLNRLSLLPGRNWPGKLGHFMNLKLEASRDGQSWQTVREGGSFSLGLAWERRTVRFDCLTGIEVNFPPQPARYVRLTLGKLREVGFGFGWELSELYLYEAKDPGQWPGWDALQAKCAAQAAIALWSSDPAGPSSPTRGRISDWRRDMVDWPTVIGHLDRALCLEPDWERPMRLLLEAYRKGSLQGRQVAPQWDAVVLEHNRSANFHDPKLAEGLWLSGNGKLSTGFLPWLGSLEITRDHPRLLPLNPGQKTPALKGLSGQVLIRRIKGAAALAAALLKEGRESKAKPVLKAVLDAKSLKPHEALELAAVLAARGRKDDSRQVLQKLDASGLDELKEFETQLQTGKSPDPERLNIWLGYGCAKSQELLTNKEAEDTPALFGEVRPDARAACGAAVQGLEGRHKPGELKVWFEPFFKKGPYVVRFRLRSAGGGEQAKLRVHRHFGNQYAGMIKEKSLKGLSPESGYVQVDLPIRLKKDLIKLEAGVAWNGKGELWVDSIRVLPDRAEIMLELLRPLKGIIP